MWVLRHSRSAEKFDVKTGRQLDEVDVGAGYLAGMQLNREGSRAVFTDSDGQLKVARRDQNKWETFSVSPTRGDFTHHALCPVADLLLIATTESLELWTFEDSLSPLIILPASRHLAWSEWSPDGSYLLVAFGDGALELRHGKTLDIVRTTQMAASGDVRCTWSPGGQYMAAYNRIGLTVSAATVWSLDNTAPSLRHVSCPLGALVAALSPDGCWLAVADLSSRVWLINVDEPSNRLDLGELTISPCAMRFATDGSSLLIGSIDGALRCWSLADRQLAWTLSDPET